MQQLGHSLLSPPTSRLSRPPPGADLPGTIAVIKRSAYTRSRWERCRTLDTYTGRKLKSSYRYRNSLSSLILLFPSGIRLLRARLSRPSPLPSIRHWSLLPLLDVSSAAVFLPRSPASFRVAPYGIRGLIALLVKMSLIIRAIRAEILRVV